MPGTGREGYWRLHLDENSHADWVEALEKPHWNSLQEVYEHARLTDEEIEALDEYSALTEFYLLRAKRPMVIGFGQNPSLVKLLAGYLRFFNSAAVKGINGNDPPRGTIIGDMFSVKKIHKVTSRRETRTLDSGEIDHGFSIRSKVSSTKFWDTLAEFQTLAFFCAKGFVIEFPPRKAQGKQPEFFIKVGGVTVGVEVKNLDTDAVLDHIFGDFDCEVKQMDKAESEITLPEKYHKITGKIKTQYNKAVPKFSKLPGLVFIYVPTRKSDLGEGLNEYLDEIACSWGEGSAPCIAGLILAFYDTIQFLPNPRHQTLTDKLRFKLIDLQDLRNVYELCTKRDLWPR